MQKSNPEDHPASSSRPGLAEAAIRTLGNLPPARALGWGLLVAWGTISTFGNTLTDQGSPASLVYWIVNLLATTLGLILFGIAGRQPSWQERLTRAMGRAMAAIVASVIIMALYRYLSLPSPMIASAFAGLLSGVGMAIGTLCWGTLYSRFDLQDIESCIVLSLVLMVGCYALGLATGPLFTIGLLIALPLGSLACYSLNNPLAKQEVAQALDGEAVQFPMAKLAEPFVFHGITLFRMGVGIVACAAGVSILWQFTVAGVLSIPSPLFSASLLSGAIVAIVLMINCVTFANQLNLTTLYRWIVPLIIFAMAFLASRNPAFLVCGSLLNFSAQMGLDALTLIFFCELAHRHPALSFPIIGIGRGFLEGGIFLGSFAALILEPALAHEAFSIEQALLGIAAVVMACTMFAIIDKGTPALQVGYSSIESPPRGEAQPHEPEGAVFPADKSEDLGRKLFEARCDRIGQQFGLSQREREVLGYLARGRSLPFIRNELCISKSTVNTHVGHIYTKLGVHSKEELIDLVESEPTPPPRSA